MEGTVTISIKEYEDLKSLQDVFDKRYEYIEIHKGWRQTGPNSTQTYSEGFYKKTEKDTIIQKFIDAIQSLSKDNHYLEDRNHKLNDEIDKLKAISAKRRYWFGI